MGSLIRISSGILPTTVPYLEKNEVGHHYCISVFFQIHGILVAIWFRSCYDGLGDSLLMREVRLKKHIMR